MNSRMPGYTEELPNADNLLNELLSMIDDGDVEAFATNIMRSIYYLDRGILLRLAIYCSADDNKLQFFQTIFESYAVNKSMKLTICKCFIWNENDLTHNYLMNSRHLMYSDKTTPGSEIFSFNMFRRTRSIPNMYSLLMIM